MKSHGPAFKRAKIDLAECSVCRGKGFTKPLFYELDCSDCHATGWVCADTGEALPLEVMVTQLSNRLRLALQQVNELIKPRAAGPEAQYEQNNRRGAGGSNYTGD